MTEDIKGSVIGGRYTILDKIGTGGMAAVYRARDESSATHVAVKILSRDFLAKNPKEAERNLRRFKREAEILKLLDGSPHVVRFIDHACSEGGDWYIAMELLEGEQLRYYIGRGRRVMGVPTFVHFAMHLLEGLKEIHSKNILHRDLAPDNVVIIRDKDGLLIPKYLDFGIGKATDSGLDQVTQMLTIMGKPQYFSPEQARGLELTTASDLYAAGVLLYEMVTGYVPLEIHGIPDFRKIQKDPPIPISNYKEGQRIPADLQGIIMRCLSKRPEDRPICDEILAAVMQVRERVNAGEIFDTGSASGPTADHTSPVRMTEVELKPGETVSRYEIKGLLGKGGMGAVYLAWDPVLHRDVAIKVATRVEEERAKKALLREARASSALRSENIVTIFDAGTEGGIPYIAMEYVKGTTLAELIDKDGPLSGSRFFEFATDICEGLRHAHEREQPVIHRDLKPANLLVDRRGLKINDFGIAKVTSSLGGQGGATVAGGETQASNMGQGEGTVATMSPEQANGKSVDHRSDIYSLGCVFYMMLTGRSPFQGNPIAILYQHCTTKAEPPSKHAPNLEPKELDAIVLKCLEKNPSDRYQNVAEVQRDLQALFEPTGSEATARKRGPLLWAAAVAVLVALGAVGFAVFRPGGSSAAPQKFSLDFVGTADAEGRFEGKKQKTFITASKSPSLWTRAAPGGEVVVTTKTGEQSAVTRLTVPESGVAVGEITLPLQAGAATSTFQVSVREEGQSDPPVEFELTYDGSEPEIEYLPYPGSSWLPLERPLKILRREDLRFRAKDQGTGFLGKDGKVASQVEFGVGEAPGGQTSASWSGEQIELTLRDRVGLGPKGSSYPVRRIEPMPKTFVAPERTNQKEVQVRTRLEADGINLEAHPLRSGIEAFLIERPECRCAMTLDQGGDYVGTLKLPPLDEGSLATFSLAVSVFGQVTEGAPHRLTIDRSPPKIRLRYGRSEDPGSAPRTFASNSSEPIGPLDVIQGADLKELLAFEASDDEAPLPPETRLEVSCGGKDLRLEISPPGIFRGLEISELPQSSNAIPVRLSLVDLAGNRAELNFEMRVLGTRATSLLVKNSPVVSDAIHINARQKLPLEVKVSNLQPDKAIYLELLGLDGTAILPSRLPLQFADGTWRIREFSLPNDGRLRFECRLRLVFEPAPIANEQVLRECRLVFDEAPPVVEAAFAGTDAAFPTKLDCGHFPAFELKIQDTDKVNFAEGIFRIETIPANLPAPKVTTEAMKPDGSSVIVRIAAPPGATPEGLYKLAFEASDLAGNPVKRQFEIGVKPPKIGLTDVARRTVKERGQFTQTAVPVNLSTVTLKIQNRSGVGRFRVHAVIQNALGAEVASDDLAGEIADGTEQTFLVNKLPEGESVIALSYIEIIGNQQSDPIHFDSVKVLLDTKEPEWELLVNGNRVEADKAKLANTDVKVSGFDTVTVRVLDDGGLPENPVVDPGTLGKVERTSKEGRTDLQLKLEPEWRPFRVSFRVEDLAGNQSAVAFSLARAKDWPELRPLTKEDGTPFMMLDSGTYATTMGRLVLGMENPNPDRVLSVEVRIQGPSGAPGRTVPLQASRDRKTFQTTIELENGSFVLAFHGEAAGAGISKAPFHEVRVVNDRMGPDLQILMDSAPASDGATLDRPDRLAVRAQDQVGVATVRWQANGPGSAGDWKLTDPTGDVYRIPGGTTFSPGSYELVFEASDRLANVTQKRLRIVIPTPTAPPVIPTPIRNDPPPPQPTRKFDVGSITSRTGLEPMPIFNVLGGRNASSPEFYLGKTETTAAQFLRFQSDVQQRGQAFFDELRRARTNYDFADRDFAERTGKLDRNATFLDRLEYAFETARSFDANMPMRFVSADVAVAFAYWAGGRLPTTAEWRNAAGHFVIPSSQCDWPAFQKGSSFESSESNIRNVRRWCHIKGVSGSSSPLAVDQLAEGSPFGLLGIVGNVQEWVSDFRGSFGVRGGSFSWEIRDKKFSPRLGTGTERPNGTTAKEFGDVGFRVLWEP